MKEPMFSDESAPSFSVQSRERNFTMFSPFAQTPNMKQLSYHVQESCLAGSSFVALRADMFPNPGKSAMIEFSSVPRPKTSPRGHGPWFRLLTISFTVLSVLSILGLLVLDFQRWHIDPSHHHFLTCRVKSATSILLTCDIVPCTASCFQSFPPRWSYNGSQKILAPKGLLKRA